MARIINSNHALIQAARQRLEDKGMHKAHVEGGREYWAYGVDDMFLDHSATITKSGMQYDVVDYSLLRVAQLNKAAQHG